MEYNENDDEDNQENDLYISNIDNDKSIKDYYNLPSSYKVKEKNDYNADNNDYDNNNNSSLIKELEDKWELIEKKKNYSYKKLLEINSKSFNTATTNNNNNTSNMNILIKEWREMIEASKQKYRMQKQNSSSVNEEDFDSFVTRKIKQLQNNSNRINHNRNKSAKSFLKTDDDNDNNNNRNIISQCYYFNVNQSNYNCVNNKLNNIDNNDSWNKQSINSNNIIHSKNNAYHSINKKIAETISIITDSNDKLINPSHNNHTLSFNELSSNNNRHNNNKLYKNQVLSRKKTDSIYLMNHNIPRKKSQRWPIKLVNTTVNKQHSKNNLAYYPVNYKKNHPDLSLKILNRITESTKLLSDLLTTTTTNNISSNQVKYYSSDKMHSTPNNKAKPIIYSKNNFENATKKLNNLDCKKVIKLMNM